MSPKGNSDLKLYFFMLCLIINMTHPRKLRHRKKLFYIGILYTVYNIPI